MTPVRCSPQNTAAPDSPAHGEPPGCRAGSRDSMVRARVPAARSLIGEVRPNACSACRPVSRVADAAGKPTAPQSSGSGPASRPHRTPPSARSAGQASTATSRPASAHATLACSQPPPGPATSARLARADRGTVRRCQDVRGRQDKAVRDQVPRPQPVSSRAVAQRHRRAHHPALLQPHRPPALPS